MATHVRLLSKLSTQRGLLYTVNNVRCLHSSGSLAAGQKRRLEAGQAANKTKYGLLTDLPDFTYLDGRPTPLTIGQKKRKDKRIEIAKRVVDLVSEIQFAKENHKNRTMKIEQEKQERLSQTLKAKVKS